MAYEFKKLNDVEKLPKVNNDDTILVIDQNEVKQTSVPKADWNEVDEQSPTFIMNKPKSLGGYKYFYYSSYYLYPVDNVDSKPDYSTIGNASSQAEFIKAYKKQPLMIITGTHTSPVLFYDNINDSVFYYEPYHKNNARLNSPALRWRV